MIIVISILLNIVLLAFVLTDLCPRIRIWVNRIHIGRWNDRSVWLEAVLNRSQKWLYHSPTVKLTDNNSLILWDILQGRYRHSTIQSWQDAGLLFGLLSSKKEKQVNTWINVKLDDKGQWREKPQHIDATLLAYVILQATDKPNQVKPAMDYIYHLILSCKEGDTVRYRKEVSAVRFVDTLGLICPFLIQYGRVYGDEQAISLALMQFKEYDIALLPKLGFPCHAFDMGRLLPRGIYDWGRGLGWYILAFVEGNRALSGKVVDFDLKERIVKLAETLLPFQNAYGGFSCIIFDTNAYPESSVTVLAGLLFHEAWLYTHNTAFDKARHQTLKSLMMVTQRNGAIDYCQGDTKGIGFYSITFDHMPFVQGLALLLANRIDSEK